MRTGNLLIYSAKFDHRTAPSFSAERDWVIDSPPIPRARPGDGRHDQLGNFQTALLGRITPASTGSRGYPAGRSFRRPRRSGIQPSRSGLSADAPSGRLLVCPPQSREHRSVAAGDVKEPNLIWRD